MIKRITSLFNAVLLVSFIFATTSAATISPTLASKLDQSANSVNVGLVIVAFQYQQWIECHASEYSARHRYNQRTNGYNQRTNAPAPGNGGSDGLRGPGQGAGGEFVRAFDLVQRPA